MNPLTAPVMASVLSCLEHGPATNQRIADMTGCTFAGVRGAATALHNRKAIHINGYAWTGKKFARVFAIGDKPDCPMPERNSVPLGPRTFSRGETEEYILKRLADGPMSLRDMCTENGPGFGALRNAASELAKKGAAHPPHVKNAKPALWTLTDRPQIRRKLLPVPPHALTSVFVGGINPWNGL